MNLGCTKISSFHKYKFFKHEIWPSEVIIIQRVIDFCFRKLSTLIQLHWDLLLGWLFISLFGTPSIGSGRNAQAASLP